MKSIIPFDVILVPFPFADLSSNKKRPCLVLSTPKPPRLKDHLVVAMITSQVSGPFFPHDVEITDYKFAGLPKPSLIRLAKVVTLDSLLILKTLGALHEKDQAKVRKEFRKLFDVLLKS